MLNKILALSLCIVLAVGLIGCDSASKLPEYAEKQFEISGFWAPYEITEESFNQYKDVGFTHFAMINHSLARTSQEQFYLGSDRTMKALEMCRKVGLKAILNYNDWIATSAEDNAEFYSETPFSQFDIYGDYKDIISGIHICDEPYTRHIPEYGNKTLVEDFKKVYPNAKYIVNLIPYTAYASRGFNSYEEMMDIYEETFMEPFDKPFVSVDVYPFHQDNTHDDGTLLLNYEFIANSAKKYGVKPGFILQSSVGGADEGKKEFEMRLSESDLRWEIYNALAYGADTLQYYCYSVPKSFAEDGTVNNMYDYCILDRENKPSEIYYSLQKLHKEIQSFASVILAYDWEETIGVLGTEDQTLRLSNICYDENYDPAKLKDCKYYLDATATQDLVVSRYTSDEYGEAYMFLNWANRDDSNSVTITFKDCKKIAIYGGAGYSGTPEIVKLDENGQANFELEYGEGVFITPIV